jgi:hypothetical protein
LDLQSCSCKFRPRNLDSTDGYRVLQRKEIFISLPTNLYRTFLYHDPVKQKHREMRGLTSAGRKYRGLRGKVSQKSSRFENVTTDINFLDRDITTIRPALPNVALGNVISNFLLSAIAKIQISSVFVTTRVARKLSTSAFLLDWRENWGLVS